MFFITRKHKFRPIVKPHTGDTIGMRCIHCKWSMYYWEFHRGDPALSVMRILRGKCE